MITGLFTVVVCARAAAAATVMVGDFHAAGGGKEFEEVFSIGLPYLVARAINGSGECQAVLPTSSAAKLRDRLYDGAGAPRVTEGSHACASAGADRYLLGRAEKKKGGALSVTFFLGAPPRPPESFSLDAAGAELIPELAAAAADKTCPRPGKVRPPQFPPALFLTFSRTLRALREGDLKKADQGAEEMGRSFTESADACWLRGLVALEEKETYKALQLFNEARNRDPRFALPAYQEGTIWLALERLSFAEKAFEDAVRIQPSYFEASLELGKLRSARGDFKRAIPDLTRAMKLRPADASARYWLAKSLAGTGSDAEAMSLLERLVSENPEDAPARLLLGRLYFEEGEMERAESELRAAIRLAPGDPEAHRLLGEALSRQGGVNRNAEAAREFQKAISLSEKKK